MILSSPAHHMKTALFLGAGASAFASLPTTKEIMDRVRERVRKRANEPHRDSNKQNYIMSVVENETYSDVEKLYDGIDQIIDTSKNSNCRPIIGNAVAENVNYEQIIEELTYLKRTIRDVLLESFVIKSDAYMLIARMYDMIWSVMEGGGTDEFQIFTTNYDTVMERYCDIKNYNVVNGFMPESRLKNVWSGKWLPAANAVYLTKVHGSITWYKDDDGKIMEIGDTTQRGTDRDIMIFPTEGAKKYDEEPFLDLLNNFKDEIERVDVLLVIGFSYRDDELVDIIKDRVENGMGLISVSPDAANDIRLVSNIVPKTIEMEGQSLKVVGPQIVLCEQKFGPDTAGNVHTILEAAYRYIGLPDKRSGSNRL